MKKQTMQARPIEILSVTAGKLVGEKEVVLITFRPNPAESPHSELVAITTEQAKRMRDDLNNVLTNSILWMKT